MPRRVTLPGADELFRTTGGAALSTPQPRQQSQQHTGGEAQGDTRPRGQGGAQDGGPEAAEDGTERDEEGAERAARDGIPGRRPLAGQSGAPVVGVNGSAAASAQAHVPAQQQPAAHPAPQQPQPAAGRRKAPRQNRRPSGRERHDEKITVYVSAEELMDLEHARLVLRGEHGLAIDRGRIVREAVAVVLADLESRGDASILVRRLRGR